MTEKVAKKGAPKKNVTPTLKPTPTPVQDNLINTKALAGMCGTTPKALRRKLRAKWYNDGVHTDYAWKLGEKVLDEILASYGQAPIGTAKAPKGKKNKVEAPIEPKVEEAVSA